MIAWRWILPSRAWHETTTQHSCLFRHVLSFWPCCSWLAASISARARVPASMPSDRRDSHSSQGSQQQQHSSRASTPKKRGADKKGSDSDRSVTKDSPSSPRVTDKPALSLASIEEGKGGLSTHIPRLSESRVLAKSAPLASDRLISNRSSTSSKGQPRARRTRAPSEKKKPRRQALGKAAASASSSVPSGWGDDDDEAFGEASFGTGFGEASFGTGGSTEASFGQNRRRQQQLTPRNLEYPIAYPEVKKKGGHFHHALLAPGKVSPQLNQVLSKHKKEDEEEEAYLKQQDEQRGGAEALHSNAKLKAEKKREEVRLAAVRKAAEEAEEKAKQARKRHRRSVDLAAKERSVEMLALVAEHKRLADAATNEAATAAHSVAMATAKFLVPENNGFGMTTLTDRELVGFIMMRDGAERAERDLRAVSRSPPQVRSASRSPKRRTRRRKKVERSDASAPADMPRSDVPRAKPPNAEQRARSALGGGSSGSPQLARAPLPPGTLPPPIGGGIGGLPVGVVPRVGDYDARCMRLQAPLPCAKYRVARTLASDGPQRSPWPYPCPSGAGRKRPSGSQRRRG